MFALVHCQQFYASCEQVFRPDLRDQPIAVFSHPDNRVIARSVQAVALGISSQVPRHTIDQLLRRHKVATFSANYALYSDLSRRVVATLQELSATVDTRSIAVTGIDNIWLGLSDSNSHREAHLIRDTLWRYLHLPANVGLAPTRTLTYLAARLANIAPGCDGVCTLDTPYKWYWLLAHTALNNVPGIGQQQAQRLQKHGIHSALDLAQANPRALRRRGEPCWAQLIGELNGEPALSAPPASGHQLYSPSTDTVRVGSEVSFNEAIAHRASGVVEALCKQRRLTRAVHVLVHSEAVAVTGRQQPHSASAVLQLPQPSADPQVIVSAARQLATSLYQPGYRRLNIAVGLLDTVPRHHYQENLQQSRCYHSADEQQRSTLQLHGHCQPTDSAAVMARRPQQGHLPRRLSRSSEVAQIRA